MSCYNAFRIKLVCTATCLITAALGSKATLQQEAIAAPERESMEQLLLGQVRCWNDGDLDGFMKTYWNSPELTFSGGGKTTRGWQATLDRYKSRYPDRDAMGKLNFADLEFRLLGDSAALVLGSWHLSTSGGEPHGNFSLVLQKIDGHWLIIHDHSSTYESDR